MYWCNDIISETTKAVHTNCCTAFSAIKTRCTIVEYTTHPVLGKEILTDIIFPYIAVVAIATGHNKCASHTVTGLQALY
jgi:hypothetical protein